MTTTLRFQPDHGIVACLYTEAIDLTAIGRLNVTRATDIRFNAAAQQWEVHEAESDRILFSNSSRTECLRWEHDNLQPQTKTSTP